MTEPFLWLDIASRLLFLRPNVRRQMPQNNIRKKNFYHKLSSWPVLYYGSSALLVSWTPRLVIQFVLLDLFFLIIVRLFLFFIGFYFIIMDLVYFIEWEIVNINRKCIVVTFLFD